MVFNVSCWLRLLIRVFHDSCLLQKIWNQAAATINIYNLNQSGSAAWDVWHTKNTRWRQLAGILGFCFRNGFLMMKYFTDSSSSSTDHLPDYKPLETRQLEKSSITEDALYTMPKLLNSRNCYYCWHGYSTPQTNRKSISFKCIQWDVLLCKPSKSQFWELHLHGLPKPNYKKKRKEIDSSVYMCVYMMT